MQLSASLTPKRLVRRPPAGGRIAWPPSRANATYPSTRCWPAGELAEDKRKKVEELIEEEEGATNRLGGWLGKAVVAFAVFVSVFHLYAAVAGSPSVRPARRSSRPTICGRCMSAWCWR